MVSSRARRRDLGLQRAQRGEMRIAELAFGLVLGDVQLREEGKALAAETVQLREALCGRIVRGQRGIVADVEADVFQTFLKEAGIELAAEVHPVFDRVAELIVEEGIDRGLTDRIDREDAEQDQDREQKQGFFEGDSMVHTLTLPR